MPTVLFSYFLNGQTTAEEFEQKIFRDVARRGLAQGSVEAGILHRTNGWPGGSDDVPDYICVVDVADLGLWSSNASASIIEGHGLLGSLMRRIEMAVAVAGVPPPSARASVEPIVARRCLAASAV